MMEIFHETKDVFQLKDIEKIAPKSKGITPMSVKDVLQSLVDDNMVDTDLQGTSNYYWAFPSKDFSVRERKQEELQKRISEEKQHKSSLEREIEKAKEGRQDTKERSSLLKELNSLREEQTQQKAELKRHSDCDPEVFEEKRKTCAVGKEAVTRWTDNIFAMKSWTKKKFAFDDNHMNKAFGIPEDFDYMN
ncbi:meiotic nuclear division protein 1 homolog isoform 1-T1 [Synchiropus picturatus]